MNRTFTCLVLFVGISAGAVAQTDTILNRYSRFLQDTLHPVLPASQLNNFDPVSQQWRDIDYNDAQPAAWKVPEHLRRVRNLALVWLSPASSYYHRTEVWQTLNAALDHWLKKRYLSANWWHNKIGVPQYMCDIIVLLRDTLSAARLSGGLQVMAQNDEPSWQKSSGANLIWGADLSFHYGALTNDRALMKRCLDRVVKEITITTAEGLQPDHSFHQHGPRLQMYHYGGAFLWDNVRLAWEVHGTDWAYPKEKIQILTSFLTDGWQWMARGINTVPGTIDRSVSRAGALHSADIRRLIPYLCELDPANRQIYLDITARQHGKGKPLEGFRYFPRSDLSVYHHRDFSFFLKTISSRTLPTESINRENLKGHLLNSGDSYLISNGQEYYNLMPAWNWERLPGVTNFTGATAIQRQSFVGSVSNGRSGATVMDYQLAGNGTKSVKAKKFWVCHNNIVVCLLADLSTSENSDPIFTTLDQCRWQQAVTVNTQSLPLGEGDHMLKQVRWIHHGNFGYIFPAPAAVTIYCNTVTGSWQSINASASGAPVTEKVFTPVIQHRLSSTASGNTAYVLASCATPAQVRALSQKPGWTILRNDKNCQAVQFRDGTIMAVFYTAQTLVINKKSIQVDKPSLLLIADNKLYASNPSQTDETVRVNVGQRSWRLQLPPDGSSTKGIR